MRVHVDAYATDGPGDVAGLERILSELPTGDIARLALVAKTEGTATISDFSRELALSAAERTIERIGGGDLLGASTLIFSTGSEGVLSPVVYVLAAIDDDSGGDQERLVIGGGADPGDDGGRTGHADPYPPDRWRGRRGDGRSRARPGSSRAGPGQEPDSQPPRRRGHRRSGDPAIIARAGSSGQSRGAAALGVALVS